LKGLSRQEVVLPFKALVEGVTDTEPSFLNFGMVAWGERKREGEAPAEPKTKANGE